MLNRLFRTKSLDELVAGTEEPGHRLRKALGPGNLIALGIGAIIGAGIFATIGTATAGDIHRPGAGPALMLSFVLTAVVCGFTALCYAEFASMVPVAGSAYTNSDADPNTGTTLYDIDSATDRLVVQAPPNDGTLNTVGALGRNVSGTVGFDIAGTGNAAYAALQMGGNTGPSSLSSIDLATGRATPIGTIDTPALSSLAVLPGL